MTTTPTTQAQNGAELDLQQLKALALAATQGKWIAMGGHIAPASHADRKIGGSTNRAQDRADYAHEICIVRGKYQPDDANAAYIAAASPAVVLDLIARIERATASHGSAAPTKAAPVSGGEREQFEEWSRQWGACNLAAALGNTCEDGRGNATYYYGPTETAFRAFKAGRASDAASQASPVGGDYDATIKLLRTTVDYQHGRIAELEQAAVAAAKVQTGSYQQGWEDGNRAGRAAIDIHNDGMKGNRHYRERVFNQILELDTKEGLSRFSRVVSPVEQGQGAAPSEEAAAGGAGRDKREAFEAWHRRKFATKHCTGQPTRDMHNGIYAEQYGPKCQQLMWEVWQAASADSPAHVGAGVVPEGWVRALHAAVAAIYFNDSSDYRSALGSVVRHLDAELAGELLGSPKAAYDKACAMLDGTPTAATAHPVAADDQVRSEKGGQ